MQNTSEGVFLGMQCGGGVELHKEAFLGIKLWSVSLV